MAPRRVYNTFGNQRRLVSIGGAGGLNERYVGVLI